MGSGACGFLRPYNRKNARSVVLCGALFACFVACDSTAFAQSDPVVPAPESASVPSPASPPKRFGDWEVTCAPSAAAGESQPDCSASQRLVAKDTGQVVFATTILPNRQSKQKEAFVGIVSVPLGGYLAPGMQLTIDKGKPYKILFETCNANGCHAGFPIEGAVLTALRKGKVATFRVWTNKTKPAEVAVSLGGLPDALGAMAGKDKK